MVEDKDIEAPIYLAVDDKTRHWIYFGVTRTNKERAASIHKNDMGGGSVLVNQRIQNGRGRKDLTLDDAGFELVECPTSLSTEEFYKIQAGDEAATRTYYNEVEEFIKKQLKCDKVVCMHSQVRNEDRIGNSDGVQGYAGFAPHTDSSPVSADGAALLHLIGDHNTKYKRYCYLNLWRNISEDPIEDNHLAMLDERTTVKPDDYIVKDIFGLQYNEVQYGLNARHAAKHKWYYFPAMKKSEGIVFKQMDSDWTKPGRICFHMSISDPTLSDHNMKLKPRESIELRMICYWKDASVDSMPTAENTNEDMVRNPLEVAKEMGSASLTASTTSSAVTIYNASISQLLYGLCLKIPLVGSIMRLATVAMGWIDNTSTTTTTAATTTAPQKRTTGYTGKPIDYLSKFTTVIDSYPQWPQVGKSWAKGEIKAGGFQQGIARITTALVDDSMNYQKTKHFEPEEKDAIVECLLASDSYIKTAEKHWKGLV